MKFMKYAAKRARKPVFYLGLLVSPLVPLQNAMTPSMMHHPLPTYEMILNDVATSHDKQRSMTAEDWDTVPFAVRKKAFDSMVDYWVDFYDRGCSPSDREGEKIALKSMMEWESGYNHRALNKTGDMGPLQISIELRQAMRESNKEDAFDEYLRDSDYYNPWYNIQVGAYFFIKDLKPACGNNLYDMIEAYNAGIRGIGTLRGENYLRNVVAEMDEKFPMPEIVVEPASARSYVMKSARSF